MKHTWIVMAAMVLFCQGAAAKKSDKDAGKAQSKIEQYVVFKVSPKNAVVSVDGAEAMALDAEGMLAQRLAPGKYSYTVEAPGYISETSAFTVDGRKVMFNMLLKSEKSSYGRLDVSTTPLECRVYVDDEYVGNSPDVFQNVTVGRHTVRLSKAGFVEQKYQVNVIAGGEVSVIADLEPEHDNGISGEFELVGRALEGALPLPDCIEEEGMIVVNITVNSDGKVISSKIDRSTTVNSPQMKDAALIAVGHAKFLASGQRGVQNGKVTYYFKLR